MNYAVHFVQLVDGSSTSFVPLFSSGWRRSNIFKESVASYHSIVRLGITWCIICTAYVEIKY